jgi:hypothetical protein
MVVRVDGPMVVWPRMTAHAEGELQGVQACDEPENAQVV